MVETETNTRSFIKKWAPLAVMGLAVIIIVLDTTLLNVSLGTIVRDLNTNIQSLQWVITAYALTLAALTITGGRFGDLFGRKRMFMLGALVFALGSFIASISHSVSSLIIGESIVEGIGAALMMPATASLLVANYRGRDRALALGAWGGMAAAGSAIGPVVGGYLTSHYSWRWGFRINIFVVVILLLGSILIKESQDQEEKPTIDWIGVLLTATGLTSIVFAVIESASYGWWEAKAVFSFAGNSVGFGGLSIVPIALAVGTLLLVGFYLWEKRMVACGETPLVSMELFKNKQFTAGATLTAVMSIGQMGLIFGLPVFLQGVRGLDALHTGYALLPMSLGLFLMAPLGGYFAKHFKPKHIVQIGLLVNVFALLLLRHAITINAGASDFIPSLFMYGCGIGLGISQLTNITLSAVSVNESGEASGVNNTLRQVGSSFGTAIIGSVIIATVGAGLSSGIKQSTGINPHRKEAVASAAATQSSSIEFGIPLHDTGLSPDEMQELKRISNESTVKANREAIIYTVVFATLSLLLTSQLPNVGLKDLEKNKSLATKTSVGH